MTQNDVNPEERNHQQAQIFQTTNSNGTRRQCDEKSASKISVNFEKDLNFQHMYPITLPLLR